MLPKLPFLLAFFLFSFFSFFLSLSFFLSHTLISILILFLSISCLRFLLLISWLNRAIFHIDPFVSNLLLPFITTQLFRSSCVYYCMACQIAILFQIAFNDTDLYIDENLISYLIEHVLVNNKMKFQVINLVFIMQNCVCLQNCFIKSLIWNCRR